MTSEAHAGEGRQGAGRPGDLSEPPEVRPGQETPPAHPHGQESTATDSENEEGEGAREVAGDRATKLASTLLGLVTATLGVGTTLQEKLILPYTDPISIKMDVTVDAQASSDHRDGMSVIILNAKATNQSERKTFLLKPHWILYGHTAKPSSSTDNAQARGGFLVPVQYSHIISQALHSDVNSSTEVVLAPKAYSGPEMTKSPKRFLGMGPLFPNQEIRHNEELKIQKVVLIPHMSDIRYIEAVINLPTLADSPTLPSRGLIKWGGCLVKAGDFNDNCLPRSETPPGRTEEQRDALAVVWRNFFCEELPFPSASNQSDLTLYQLINIYSLRHYQSEPLKQSNSLELENRFCSKQTGGLSEPEKAELGAKLQTYNHALPVRAGQP